MSLCLNNRVLFTIEFQAIIALIFFFFSLLFNTYSEGLWKEQNEA